MHLVTFDIDGTLIDSQDFDSNLYVESIQKVLNVEIGSDWSKYKQVTDSGILNQIIEENNLHHSSIDIHRKVHRCFVKKTEDYISNLSGSLTEIPGAKKLIEALSTKKGVALAIATGGWEETARMKLQAIGIDSGSFPLATASDSPDRIEIMQIAERRALNGKTAHKKTYFGDGEWDRIASNQLGYQFVGVGNSVESTFKVSAFRNLEAIFAKLGV
ncbi:HAD family hydrolase [Fodinibius salsisoli]|uniref:HAD family hydrolase n=1 Tax=Fodinibius salsisoli TaxID=2820877 RepID=A0ABT3PSU2_9BACT|nr:HAD hydrolase-like protein [Fodinibius salsisoli]MCW9708921.1 HAD family hydrolase [Fodinibius salsisoli]